MRAAAVIVAGGQGTRMGPGQPKQLRTLGDRSVLQHSVAAFDRHPMVGALIAFASAVTFLLTVDLLPQKMAAGIQAITANPLVFNLLVAGVLVARSNSTVLTGEYSLRPWPVPL